MDHAQQNGAHTFLLPTFFERKMVFLSISSPRIYLGSPSCRYTQLPLGVIPPAGRGEQL